MRISILILSVWSAGWLACWTLTYGPPAFVNCTIDAGTSDAGVTLKDCTDASVGGDSD